MRLSGVEQGGEGRYEVSGMPSITGQCTLANQDETNLGLFRLFN